MNEPPAGAGDQPVDFVGRHALMTAVADWYEHSAQPYFVIGGQAGTGKSAALRAIADEFDTVVQAVHVCRPGVVRDRLPAEAAAQLSTQLASQPAFAQALVRGAAAGSGDTFSGTAHAGTVSGNGRNIGLYIEHLVLGAGSDQKRWDLALGAPLRQLGRSASGHHGVLIVVDALDEADQYDGGTTLTDLITAPDPDSPARWLVSSRYDAELLARLAPGTYRRWDLSNGAGAAETRTDIATFLRRWLASSIAAPATTDTTTTTDADTDALIALAAQRCEGNFLFARLLVAALDLAELPITEAVLRQAPTGLAAILADYVRRIVDTDRHATWLSAYYPVLSALSVVHDAVTAAELKAITGVPRNVVVHVLRRLSPLLTPEALPADQAEPSFGLYHAAFREFLADAAAAGTWHCDPLDAHLAVLSGYDKLTAGWTRWDALDGYAARFLFEHAREARWTAAEFDQLVTGAHLARLAAEPGAVAFVTARLRTPITVALAQPDLRRALAWSWLDRLLRGSLEELAFEAPALLARLGRFDLVVQAAALNDEYPVETRARSVLAFAGEGALRWARAIIDIAPRTEQPRLLIAAAAGTARINPVLALDLLGEARTAGFNASRPGVEVRELAAALARYPDFVGAAEEIARLDPSAYAAVIMSTLEHDPAHALELALRHDVAWARDRAFAALAVADLDAALTALHDLHDSDWASAAIAMAAVTALPIGLEEVVERLAHSPLQRLLLLGAHTGADPRRTELVLSCEEELSGYTAFLLDAFDDAEMIKRIDFAPFTGIPEAVRTMCTALLRAFSLIETRSSAEAGIVCGALWVLDRRLGEDCIGTVERRRSGAWGTFAESLADRMTAIEPATAWSYLHDVVSGDSAWAALLPEARVHDGIPVVAGVSPRYSGTRARLAGRLAAKLPAHDRAHAEELLQLLTPTAESLIFAGDRQVVAAGLGYEANEADYTTSAEGAAAYAGALHRRELARLLAIDARHEVSTPTPSLAGLADALWPSRQTPIAIVLLGHTANRLANDPRAALLAEALNPYYRPASAQMPRWARTACAVEVAWAAAHQIPYFCDRVLDLAVQHRPDDLGEIGLALWLAGGSAVSPIARRVDARLGRVLQALDEGAEGDIETVLAAVADDTPTGIGIMLGGLLGLATVRPRAAVRIVRAPQTARLRSLFGLANPDHEIVRLLPAVARADLEYALALADDMRRKSPSSTYPQHALHAIAAEIAGSDWARALGILASIDFVSIRGMAIADLAGTALRIPAVTRRSAAYRQLLDLDLPAEDGFGEDYAWQGMLSALAVDPAPPPTEIASILPRVLSGSSVDVNDWFRLAQLAATIGRATAADPTFDDLGVVEHLVQSAWRV